MGVIDQAVSWAVDIANDDTYRYVWGGWGASDGGYDCSHFVITAYKNAGIDTGATYTGDMYSTFTQHGFQDVTNQVDFASGSGLKKGDVLIAHNDKSQHAALVQADGGTTVEAWCSAYGIVANKQYRNDNWDYALRYPENGSATTKLQPQREVVINVPEGLGKYYTYMNWNTVTNMDTEQGRLIKTAGRNYNSEGYGIVGNRYTLAMTSTFGAIGDYVDVYMSDGRIIHGILADEKSQEYTSWDHNPANKWGHDDGQCIVEWVTNWNGHDNPPSNGSVLKVVNLGNYFEYPEYASGSESYYYSENAYENTEPTVIWNNRQPENIHKILTSLKPIKATGELSVYINDVNVVRMMGDWSWSNSTGELSTTMSFSIGKSDAQYLKDLLYVPDAGDIVRVVIDEEEFTGVILSVDDSDQYVNKYTAADLGWYLNKTKQTYQFKNITATQAIKELCEDLSIPIDSIPDLTTNVNYIFFSQTPSEIIKKILEQCSGKFNFDMTHNGLRIYRIGDIRVSPLIQVASNVQKCSSVAYMGNLNHSKSIENMATSVKVVSTNNNAYKELVVKQNREAIDKYGFLQEIVSIDEEKENAETVGQSKLDELCKQEEKLSFEIIEEMNSYTRAGAVISIGGVDYIITSTQHSVKGGFHYNQMEVEKL